MLIDDDCGGGGAVETISLFCSGTKSRGRVFILLPKGRIRKAVPYWYAMLVSFPPSKSLPLLLFLGCYLHMKQLLFEALNKQKNQKRMHRAFELFFRGWAARLTASSNKLL